MAAPQITSTGRIGSNIGPKTKSVVKKESAVKEECAVKESAVKQEKFINSNVSALVVKARIRQIKSAQSFRRTLPRYNPYNVLGPRRPVSNAQDENMSQSCCDSVQVMRTRRAIHLHHTCIRLNATINARALPKSYNCAGIKSSTAKLTLRNPFIVPSIAKCKTFRHRSF